jgi:release factor glutamine methyltransferase
LKVWTVQRLLKWTEEYLEKRGISSPRWEAEQLLAHLIDANRLDLYLDPHRPLLPQELTTFKDLMKRRTQGEPLQYITGRQGFWKHEFRVEPGILIPRSDSEVLVQATLEGLKKIEYPRILDVGTGTGCLIISILADLPKARGVATDIGTQALRLARGNATRIKVQDRLSFVLGDLLTPFKEEAFHAIISNPPYVAEEEWDSLPKEVRDKEPPQALKGGKEGLFYLGRLIAQGWRHLLPGGFLIMEIGWQQMDKVTDLFKGKPYTGIEFFSDLGGRDRMVLGRRN